LRRDALGERGERQQNEDGRHPNNLPKGAPALRCHGALHDTPRRTGAAGRAVCGSRQGRGHGDLGRTALS